MIKNIRHTGIVVQDLNKMASFYRSLGFVDNNHVIEEGEFIDTVTGLKNTKLEWIKMKAADGNLIELLKYHSHPKNNKFNNSPVNKLGCSHIAFTVNNIEKACEKICYLGGSVINKPISSPDNKAKVAYCYDPEGILIEIVEAL